MFAMMIYKVSQMKYAQPDALHNDSLEQEMAAIWDFS
jgi:hypothetical protein